MSATGSWPAAVPPWRQQATSPDAQQPRQLAGRAVTPPRRSRLAVGASASSQPAPEGAASPAQPPASSPLPHTPSASSANEPQLTVIHGPWPPPPSPPRQIASPRGRPQHTRSGSNLASAFSDGQQAGPSWRQLDDGSWASSAEVEWYEAESRAEAAAAAAAEEASAALLGCPLVEAASQSPPLSPVTTQLLSMRHPSTDLRRGPQRAASLGLTKPERQPSLMSPERQHSPLRLPSAPAMPEPEPEIQPEAEPSPPLQQANGSGSDAGRASPGAMRPQRMQVLNASPDVTPSGPTEPGLFPAAAASGGGNGGGFSSLGGLPVELLEKRERRKQPADLSPREAYSGDEAAWRRADLRTPLLAMPLPTESEAEEGLPASLAGHANLWASTALLATPLLGVGLVAAPRVFALLGLVAGSISLAATALASFLSLSILLRASRRTSGYLHGSSYAAVAWAALGPAGAVVTDLSLALNCFGLMAASLVVLGDILVGSGSEGLLGEWSGDRATVLAVVVLVVLAPLASCRDLSALAGSSALALVASCMAAAAVLALTALAASQHALHHPRAWPAWPELGAGGAGWFRRAAEVLAVVPVLLLATLCHPSLHAVMQQVRPSTTARAHRASGLALAYGSVLLALLGICGYALFGSGVQPDVVLDLSPEALVSLAGDPLGRAAYLLVHLALAVCLSAGFPVLMVPFRDALWRVLFWQPLVGSAGLYLVTLLAAVAALWASLALPPGSLWTLLSLLGGSTGALLALILPGLVAVRQDGMAHTCGGAMLVVLGAALAIAAILRLAFFAA